MKVILVLKIMITAGSGVYPNGFYHGGYRLEVGQDLFFFYCPLTKTYSENLFHAKLKF